MDIMKSDTYMKPEKINLRLPRPAKRALEQAASVEDTTVSQFSLTSALAQAEGTIQAHENMRLNRKDAKAFWQALVNPASFNDTLTAALADHGRRVNPS